MSLTHQRPSPLVIPELLEAILLHVDELTLLVSAQRVSKHWHAVIAVSPRLQWKLFLRPDESAAAARVPQQNPFLAKAFPFCFDPRVVGRLMVFEPKPGNRPILWAKSNILAARPPVLELHRADFWYHFPQCPRLWARQAAFARPDASWRRMLVHQPPVFLSNVLTPMWQGLPLSWIQLKETGASSTSGGPGEGPSSPCQMQDLLRSIFREFSASHDKSNTLTCSRSMPIMTLIMTRRRSRAAWPDSKSYGTCKGRRIECGGVRWKWRTSNKPTAAQSQESQDSTF
ncbi:hypothetical protein PG999_002383 [Apiospora kogelbergensis]|uniref:F-box domain-containing protein n=1 Tax=Apiospora kogelbergensis TaxID=1337665 RepID=A0AAW0R8A3_9PEZI